MKKTLIVVGAVVAALLFYWLASPKQVMRSEDVQDFERFVPALLEEEAIPGLAIAVVRNHEVVHMQGYGFADVDSRRPMTAETPMNIASISKPILGIVLLQLHDKGLLALDADINGMLPFRVNNPNADGRAISIRQLATHTSGIADFYEVSDYQEGADSTTPLVDHVRGLLTPNGDRYEDGAHYLLTAPGAAREYSNLGAGVAGAVAEAVGGASLATLAKTNVFEPLGMTNSSWLLADYRAGDLATRYDVVQCLPLTPLCASTEQPKRNFLIRKVFRPASAHRRFEAYPQFGNPNYPDGGVNSSARDLALLAQSILARGKTNSGQLLSAASFDEMLKLQLPASIDDRQRFFWRDRNGLTGHAGSDLGVYTSLYFDTAKGNAIVVLMNRTPDLQTEEAMARLFDRISRDLLRP